MTLLHAMSRIQAVSARQVFDACGEPTIEAEVSTAEGVYRAIAPSAPRADLLVGGIHAARELRDGDQARFAGRGVLKAIEAVSAEIADAIIGMDPTDQEGIDQAMIDLDGSDDAKKSRLGSNTILAVSMAVCRAGAAKKAIPLYKHINALAGNPPPLLPVPCFGLIRGGKLSPNGIAFQEFSIMPTAAETFSEALRIGVDVFQTLKHIITKAYGRQAAAVTEDGAFAPPVRESEDALKLLVEAVKAAGFEDHVQIAVGIAATEFYDNESTNYDLAFKRKGGSTSPGAVPKTDVEMSRMYKLFAANFAVASIEDPFHQDDWAAFSRLTSEVGEVMQVVGDDLLCSNADRIETAIEHNACNALLLKMDQAGTVSEAIAANSLARNSGMGVIVSHRVGDTEDSFIADLAAGLGTGQIKAGGPCRSERLAKYNQLLRIEEDLGEEATYAGDYWRDPWMITPSKPSKNF